jgi:CRP/FNR family transcriptional regulator, nitrogen oxide reductase regulator
MKSYTSKLFSGLARNEIDAVKEAAARRSIEPSQIIVRANEVADRLFLVETGFVDFYVSTEDGRQILLRRLAAGDIFGVAAFLSHPIGYLGTAKSVRHLYALEWQGRVIRQIAKTYPQLVENALRTALGYLAMYAKRHIALVSNTSQERLAWALSSLGSRTGHAVPNGVEVDINNEDLASLADVGLFTVSRTLSDWDRHEVLEKSRGKVIIRSPEKLLAA